MTIKYPGEMKSSSNHKKRYCADGVRIAHGNEPRPPPWSQPDGIFINGETFKVTAFLEAIRNIYIELEIRGQEVSDLDGQQLMFLRMFAEQRIVLAEDPVSASESPRTHTYFRLFRPDLYTVDLPATSDLLFIYEDATYLRVDCLDS